MSASATKCRPPPAQVPLTAAMTGFDTPLCQAVMLQLGPTCATGLLTQCGRVACKLHDVEPGLERAALARVDDDPNIRVGVERVPGRLQLVEHLRVHGVALVWPVENQPTHSSVTFDQKGLVSHQLRGTSRHGFFDQGSGSRGSPSTRSPTMFLLTSVVPPSMVLARLRSIPLTS